MDDDRQDNTYGDHGSSLSISADRDYELANEGVVGAWSPKIASKVGRFW